MLVLSRKESQRIRLGDSIVVTIVKISGDKVRVGIEAPADVLVLRDELEVRSDLGAALKAATTAPESLASTSVTGVAAAAPAPLGSAELLSALQRSA
jgi:carbon storage regulator